MLLVGAIYFLFLVILFIYLPGRFLLRISNFTLAKHINTLSLEIGVGSAFFIASVYLLSWIHSELLYLFLLLPVIFIEVKQLFSIYKKVQIHFPSLEHVIILLGSLTALYITGRSGYEINGNLFFYGVNATDAIFHISLIGNLMHHFPPSHAGMAGISLHGYNFLYDLLIASFAKFFFLNPLDLFFRYFSFFVALFYGFSSLSLSQFLGMNKVTTRFFLFLAYFAQGVTFLFHYVGISYDPGIVQPLANIVDPSVLFSLSLFYVSFLLLFSQTKKSHVVITAIVLSVIPMLKIYTAFLLFAALGVVTVISFLSHKKEKWQFASLLLLACVFGGLIYAPINLGVGKLIFAPFLFYTHFFESYAPLNHSDWWMRMLVYIDHKNYLRIIQNYLLLLALFFIPSLSLRLFGIVEIKSLFSKKFYSLPTIFIASAIIFGILIPSFFIQSIAVFVIVQFLWITYFLLLIPTSYGLATIYQFLPKIGKIIFVFCVIAISLPDLVSLLMFYSQKPLVVPSSIVDVTHTIKTTIPKSSGLIVLNTHKEGQRLQTNTFIPLISALSEHDVYYEPEVLEFSGLDSEVVKRKTIIATIDETLSQCDRATAESTLGSLLHEANSSYLMTFTDMPCFHTLPSLKLVSRKGEAALYKYR